MLVTAQVCILMFLFLLGVQSLKKTNAGYHHSISCLIATLIKKDNNKDSLNVLYSVATIYPRFSA